MDRLEAWVLLDWSAGYAKMKTSGPNPVLFLDKRNSPPLKYFNLSEKVLSLNFQVLEGSVDAIMVGGGS